MRTNQAGVDIIKHFEQLHDGDETEIGLQPKLCPAGIWTVGYGHALRGADGKFLRGAAGKAEAYRQHGHMTVEEAEALLSADLDEFEDAVEKLVKIKLSSNSFSALVSFAYNVGISAFGTSTLLKRVNAGRFYEAAGQFSRWNKSKGEVLNGLTKRRKAERDLFLMP